MHLYSLGLFANSMRRSSAHSIGRWMNEERNEFKQEHFFVIIYLLIWSRYWVIVHKTSNMHTWLLHDHSSLAQQEPYCSIVEIFSCPIDFFFVMAFRKQININMTFQLQLKQKLLSCFYWPLKWSPAPFSRWAGVVPFLILNFESKHSTRNFDCPAEG